MMSPTITCEQSDWERQKLEVEGKEEDTSSDSSSDYDPEEIQNFKEEVKRNGYFDFDFSKIRKDSSFKQVIFDDNYLTNEPDTDGALLQRLSRLAIKKHNDDQGTNLELVNVLKANHHPGSGDTIYITFEAKDATQLHPNPFQTVISYLPMDIRIRWCKPKP